MKTITVTARDINSKTAFDYSYLLKISTCSAKDGVKREANAQAKQLKRLLAKAPNGTLTYEIEVPKKEKVAKVAKPRLVKMDLRQGKETKSSKVRAMILELDKTLGKSALIKKFQTELDFSYSLAYTYYAKNRAILVKTGKIVDPVEAVEA